MSSLEERLGALSAQQLKGMRRGIEKESLRVATDGALATTPHPHALGSALTHPHITTDFSEAQLEFVTAAHTAVQDCLDELVQIHQFALRAIGDEMLWVSSMPCGLPDDARIPLARYGSSNVGRIKHVYRTGLGHRYGRRMQTISGIHYNWSMPGLSSERYFDLIRNFRRHSFLLLYLFGASPAVCSSFVEGRSHTLEVLRGGTLHMPYGTSLRMGRLGYRSDAQATLAVSYNSLEQYAATLKEALTRPWPAYEAIGVHDGQGGYRQLDTSLLQIENEFYGTIRPKRVIHPGERPLHALRERGVEYVEVRCLDLDPFEPVGIGSPTMHFLDVFLLHCLLADSPPDTPQEIAALSRNQHRTAASGRDPALRLERGGAEVALRDWAAEVLAGCAPIAQLLDRAQGSEVHARALADAVAALEHPERLPSARVLQVMASEFSNSYLAFALARSTATRRHLLGLPWSRPQELHFERLAQESRAEQARMEAADTVSFETFRVNYLAPQRLDVESLDRAA